MPKAVDGFDWSTCASPRAGGATRCSRSTSSAAPRTSYSTAPPAAARPTWRRPSASRRPGAGCRCASSRPRRSCSKLGKAKREGALDRLLADVGRAELVILDEFGYVPFDVDGARLLYQVISDSYERRSIVFTTNVGVQPVGHGLRGRQARRRDRGPRRPPRQARRVRRPQPPARGGRSCSASQEARGVPAPETEKTCVLKPRKKGALFWDCGGILDQIHPMRLAPNPFGTAWGSCNPGRS